MEQKDISPEEYHKYMADMLSYNAELLEQVSALTKRLEDVIKVKDELYYKCEALTKENERLKDTIRKIQDKAIELYGIQIELD